MKKTQAEPTIELPARNNISHLLFLHIETTPIPYASALPHWEGSEQDYEKAAPYLAEYATLTRLTVGGFNPKTHLYHRRSWEGTEEEILLKLSSILTHLQTVVAHNAIDIVIPFLAKRYLALGIPLPKPLDIAAVKPWDMAHKDTAHMWRMTTPKATVSLPLLCMALGIPMTDPCTAMTRAYLKMRQLPALDDTHFSTDEN